MDADASAHFEAREYHLVEPETACHLDLAVFEPPRFVLHKVALAAQGVESVVMAGGGPLGKGTAAFVASGADTLSGTVRYPAVPLDSLVGERLTPGDRLLMKVDVEGYELEILGGSTHVLNLAEVVIVEFQLFDETGNLPLLADLIEFMRRREFLVYDIAVLSGRPRDARLRMSDMVFVHTGSQLLSDNRWE